MADYDDIDSFLPEEFQTQTSPQIPLAPTPAEAQLGPVAPAHPMLNFDIRTPEQLKAQIKIAEETAKFFKSHWLWFYVSIGVAAYRAHLQADTNRSVRRLAIELDKKKTVKNPYRRKRGNRKKSTKRRRNI